MSQASEGPNRSLPSSMRSVEFESAHADSRHRDYSHFKKTNPGLHLLCRVWPPFHASHIVATFLFNTLHLLKYFCTADGIFTVTNMFSLFLPCMTNIWGIASAREWMWICFAMIKRCGFPGSSGFWKVTKHEKPWTTRLKGSFMVFQSLLPRMFQQLLPFELLELGFPPMRCLWNASGNESRHLCYPVSMLLYHSVHLHLHLISSASHSHCKSIALRSCMMDGLNAVSCEQV